ncbi:hypothetical protein INR49_005913 [Caranx melampygus]|nr:hypothetical protein INR49_005913 [Caranx melampygus]
MFLGAHPSMVCEEEEEEEEEEELFWSASLPLRSQAAENNELTSRLLTSRKNMAARGHASDQNRKQWRSDSQHPVGARVFKWVKGGEDDRLPSFTHELFLHLFDFIWNQRCCRTQGECSSDPQPQSSGGEEQETRSGLT